MSEGSVMGFSRVADGIPILRVFLGCSSRSGDQLSVDPALIPKAVRYADILRMGLLPRGCLITVKDEVRSLRPIGVPPGFKVAYRFDRRFNYLQRHSEDGFRYIGHSWFMSRDAYFRLGGIGPKDEAWLCTGRIPPAKAVIFLRDAAPAMRGRGIPIHCDVAYDPREAYRVFVSRLDGGGVGFQAVGRDGLDLADVRGLRYIGGHVISGGAICRGSPLPPAKVAEDGGTATFEVGPGEAAAFRERAYPALRPWLHDPDGIVAAFLDGGIGASAMGGTGTPPRGGFREAAMRYYGAFREEPTPYAAAVGRIASHDSLNGGQLAYYLHMKCLIRDGAPINASEAYLELYVRELLAASEEPGFAGGSTLPSLLHLLTHYHSQLNGIPMACVIGDYIARNGARLPDDLALSSLPAWLADRMANLCLWQCESGMSALGPGLAEHLASCAPLKPVLLSRAALPANEGTVADRLLGLHGHIAAKAIAYVEAQSGSPLRSPDVALTKVVRPAYGSLHIGGDAMGLVRYSVPDHMGDAGFRRRLRFIARALELAYRKALDPKARPFDLGDAYRGESAERIALGIARYVSGLADGRLPSDARGAGGLPEVGGRGTVEIDGAKVRLLMAESERVTEMMSADVDPDPPTPPSDRPGMGQPAGPRPAAAPSHGPSADIAPMPSDVPGPLGGHTDPVGGLSGPHDGRERYRRLLEALGPGPAALVRMAARGAGRPEMERHADGCGSTLPLLADAVNALAVEATGDVILEGEPAPRIVEDYAGMIAEALEEAMGEGE